MRVGTRSRVTVLQVRLQDHPHACGDKVESNRTAGKTAGSSPCVWGQESARYDTAICRGIIPMRVGTSQTEYQTEYKR